MYSVCILKIFIILLLEETPCQSAEPSKNITDLPPFQIKDTCKVTSPKDYPFVVAVEGGPEVCGGVLITKRLVLTSTRCVDKQKIEKGKIFLLAQYGDSQLINRTAKKAETASKFNNVSFYGTPPELRYDLAIILADKPFDLENMKTVSLPKPGFTAKCKSVILLGTGQRQIGFNFIQEVGHARSLSYKTLKCISMNLLDITQCKASYKGSTLDDSLLCTKENGWVQEGCQSDSGHPLLCNDGQKNIVIGILSSGFGCGIANKTILYSKVEHYLDMIKEMRKKTGELDDGPTEKSGVLPPVPPHNTTTTATKANITEKPAPKAKSHATTSRIIWELISIVIILCLYVTI